MAKSWSIDVGGERYAIEYKAGFGVKVVVNGQATKVKSQSWLVNLIDYPVPIPGANVRVVAIGSKVDLAIDGVYQGTGEEYKPLESIPGMVKTLMAISVVGGFLISGIIGMLIGILFSTLYIKFSLNDQKNKVIPTFIGWVAVEAVLFAIVFMLA